jgi:hypothetical protein
MRTRPPALKQFRNENNRSDSGGGQCGAKDGACGEILDATRSRVDLRRDQINQVLDRGIESFRGPNQTDGENDRDPFCRGYVEPAPKRNRQCREDGVDPCVCLACKKMGQPAERITERANPRAPRAILREKPLVHISADLLF